MIKLLTAIICIGTLLACTPVPGWVPSTIAQQTTHAGAVISGKVDSVTPDASSASSYIHLVDAVFYKGCGPSYVRINGFTSSAACGIDPPAVGAQVIVFVCRDGYHWSLNNINIHTGSVPFSKANLMAVMKSILVSPKCIDCIIKASKCTKPLKPLLASADLLEVAEKSN